jgi:hypothetical protein
MDNFFEILIYVIIIISFLSSIFKKKKAKAPHDQRPESMQYDTSASGHMQEEAQPEITVTRQSQKSEYDIMKEIEDFFKVGGEQTESLPEKAESLETKTTVFDESKEQGKFKEHIPDESWHTTTLSEHTYSDFRGRQSAKREGTVEKKAVKVDSKIEEQAARFEKQLEKYKPTTSEISKKIKERLKNPASLKDYIIIAEIMNKPKALRR